MVVDLPPWKIGPSFAELDLGYLDLVSRTVNALKNHGIKTVGELAAMTAQELREAKRIGRKSVEEIEWKLGSVALELAGQ